jgi:selenium-binding protein 1
LHHFGWNACSTALCPYAPHPHLERRYLVVPGLRSSRIHIVDTKPDPTKLEIVKIIEPEELFARTGYSRPHTVHCGPEGIYVSALGAPNGGGPGGIFLLDHFDFNVLGRWEVDRGPQELAYDFWWHLGHDTMITSEWGIPNKIENGVDPEHLLSGGYGHQLHVWDLRRRKHLETIELGKEQQMVLELRPSHDPTRTFGFAGVVVSLKDLSASI